MIFKIACNILLLMSFMALIAMEFVICCYKLVTEQLPVLQDSLIVCNIALG